MLLLIQLLLVLGFCVDMSHKSVKALLLKLMDLRVKSVSWSDGFLCTRSFSLQLALHVIVGKFSICFPEIWGKLFPCARQISLECTAGLAVKSPSCILASA